ncbi:MAG: hypothetical protein CVV30_11305 [Methanomicrobiales archaeon HGW-Methanomicrobiales-1]|jgi:hypothetical protein|nr:MAG: hypothetical protein CVV30_11305 [Methanomicrobiales archaeon HGW-Methanomicrobiales-1]
MNTDATVKKIQNLEIMIASLTELLDVQEIVVGEQSELIEQDKASLKESNDRFLSFIKEATMRFKNPLVVIEENLASVVNDIERDEFESRNAALLLKVQIKNLEQIRLNIIELNKAIIEHSGEMSEVSKKFLME